jgi:hypothetical protein
MIDDGLDFNNRRSNRTRNPPKLLTFKDFQAARNWQEMADNMSDMKLFTAYQTEAEEPPINLSAMDPSPFMPPLMGIRLVLKMSELKVREAWLRAYQREIKTLIDAKTFALDKPKYVEPVIPTMETNKVKTKSDGSLDKLKEVIHKIQQWRIPGHLQHPLGPLKCSWQMQLEVDAEYIS